MQDSTPKENSSPTPKVTRTAFVSHASQNKEKAQQIVQSLEERGLSCWVAPRDLRPGEEYGEEIMRGIRDSRCLVLVLSEAANESGMVRREVERAVSLGKPVFPIRIEEVLPSRSLEFFVSSTHWIDAWQDTLNQHIERLADHLTDESTIEEVADLLNSRKRKQSFFKKLSVGSTLTIVLLTIMLYVMLSGDNQASDPHNDPVRTYAKSLGIDIDDIDKDDIDLDAQLGGMLPSLVIRGNNEVLSLGSHGAIQMRIGDRPWQIAYSNPMGEGLMYMLKDSDYDAGNTVTVQIAPPPGQPGKVYGPFKFKIDLNKEKDQLEESKLYQAKQYVSRVQWMEKQNHAYWRMTHDASSALVEHVKKFEFGLQEDNLETVVKVSQSELDIEVPEMLRETMQQTFGQQASSQDAYWAVAKALQRLKTPLQLYVRVTFSDDSQSEIRMFDASPSVAEVLQENQNLGSLSYDHVSIYGLKDVHDKITHLRIRHRDGEPYKEIEVLTNERIDKDDNLFSITFPPTSIRYGTADKINIPQYWNQVELEVAFNNGQTIRPVIEHRGSKEIRGFMGVPIGENASEAPALYISHNRGRFEFFPWNDSKLRVSGNLPEAITHPEDTVTLSFYETASNETLDFQYKMTNLVEIEEDLEFSIRLTKVKPIVVHQGNIPSEKNAVSRDGSKILALLKNGEVLVYESKTGTLVSKIEDKFSYAYLSPDGARVLGNYDRESPNSGNWGLYDTESGRLIKLLVDPSGRKASGGRRADFSPDGRFVSFRNVSYDYSNLVRKNGYSHLSLSKSTNLWALEDGSPYLPSGTEFTYLVGVFDGDSSVVVLDSRKTTLRSYDISRSEPKLLGELSLPERILSIAMSPDGSSIAYMQKDVNEVAVLDSKILRERFRVFSETAGNQPIPYFSKDGSKLLVRPRLSDRELELYDARTGQSVFQFPRSGIDYISPSLYALKSSQNSDIGIYRTSSSEVLEFLPFKRKYNYSKGPFTDKEDFLLYLRNKVVVSDSQSAYFIDVKESNTKQLLIPSQMSCKEFNAPDTIDFVISNRSDGAVVLWPIRSNKYSY